MKSNLNFIKSDIYNKTAGKIIYNNNIPKKKCSLCHYSKCICDKKNIYTSKNNHVYKSFNKESEQKKPKRSLNNNIAKRITYLNVIKPHLSSFLNENNKYTFFSPSSMRDSQLKKKLNNSNQFMFYNYKENFTRSQNNVKEYHKFVKDDKEEFSNILNTQYFNYKKQNSSVIGKGLSPYFHNLKKFSSNFDYQHINRSPEFTNKNNLTLNNNTNKVYDYKCDCDCDDDDLDLKKGKKGKYRKIFNSKFITERDNITINSSRYNSYVNINERFLNNNRIKKYNRDREYFSPLNNNRIINQEKTFIKKTNNDDDKNFIRNIKNIDMNSNNINCNINNNYNYQISASNIINIQKNTIEQAKKYYSFHYDELTDEKNTIKNIISLRKRNKIINNKDTIHSEEFFPKNSSNINEMKFNINDNSHINQLLEYKRTGERSEFTDTNKENFSNNVIQSYLIKNEKSKKKYNIKLFDKLKTKYSQQLSNNEQQNKNLNVKISFNSKNYNKSNNSKAKNNELINLLNKANAEIEQLKFELNCYKNYNNSKNLNNKKNSGKIEINVNKISSNNNSNINTKNNNCFKINIPEKKIIKSQIVNNNNLNLKSERNLCYKNNKQKKNISMLNTLTISNILKYYSSNNMNINKKSNINKYIYALYYSANEYFNKYIICFDAETKAFKIRNINNTNFNKNFNDSINRKNKKSRSIYLIKDNYYHIVTGPNCNKFYQYDYYQDKIIQLNDLKFNHSNGNMISFYDNIVCLSGDYNKKVELFLENEKQWIELPEMQVERSHFCSCIIKDKYIFAFFGYNVPNKTYIDSIEYFDIINYMLNIQNKKDNIINWSYLEYNYFSDRPSCKKINLIGSVAVNYNNEKIIFLGGKNYLEKNDEGYYELIVNDTNINDEKMDGYFEKIKTKGLFNFHSVKSFFNYNYKYIEELNQDNVLKEPVFVAFDNNYFVHLIKLSTMNHETYKINQ